VAANNIIFEAQTAIFAALQSNTNFTALVSNFRDSPLNNQDYPYVVLEDNNSLPSDVHALFGKTSFFSFGIYTNTGDFYLAEQIHAAMDEALHMQRFTLETSGNKMRICHFFSSNRFQNGDIRGKIVNYRTILHDRTLVPEAPPSSAALVTAWTVPSSPVIDGFDISKDVDNSTTELTVAVTVSDNATWALFSDAECTVEIADKTMDLAVGDNTAYLKVTAEDEVTYNIYTLTIDRAAASSAALVTAWTVPSSPVIDGFDISKDVDNSTTELTVAVTVSDNATWALFSDAECTVEIADKTVDLAVGDNTAYLKVTAEDEVTYNIYTLTIARAAASSAALVTVWTVPSSPVIDGFDISKDVDNSTTELTVAVTVSDNATWALFSDAECTVEIADKTVDLAVGDNTAYLKVTAEDEVTYNIYTLTIARAAASSAALVTVWTVPSSPVIDGFDISKDVDNSTTELTVAVTVSDNATWALFSDAECTVEIADKTVDLAVGDNTAYLKVTAEDEVTYNIYTLTIARAAASSAALVTVWTVPSSPVIDGFDISKDVDNSTTELTVAVTVSDNATWALFSDAECTVEIADKTVDLAVGDNTAYLKVTAEDEVTYNIYTLTIARAASSAALVTAWTVPSSPVIDGFDISKDVDNSTTELTVAVTVSDNATWALFSDAECTVEIVDKTMDLAVGDNTAYLKVTAEDEVTYNIYTLTIARAAESGYSGILDDLNIKAAAVLGFAYERLTVDYTGYCVKVSRSSDYAEQDFGFDENGNIDSAAIETWVGAGNEGYVSTWYNQRKIGSDATQSNVSFKPIIVSSGVFESSGLLFDGTGDFLTMTKYSEINITTLPVTIYTNITNPSIQFDVVFWIGNTGNSAQLTIYVNSTLYGMFINNGEKVTAIQPSTTGNNKLIFTWAGTGTNQAYSTDGTNSETTTKNASITEQVTVYIGRRGDGTKFSGNIKTLVMFNTDEYSKYSSLAAEI
jgi:hypothetical protein